MVTMVEFVKEVDVGAEDRIACISALVPAAGVRESF